MTKFLKNIIIFICIFIFSSSVACSARKTEDASSSKQSLSSNIGYSSSNLTQSSSSVEQSLSTETSNSSQAITSAQSMPITSTSNNFSSESESGQSTQISLQNSSQVSSEQISSSTLSSSSLQSSSISSSISLSSSKQSVSSSSKQSLSSVQSSDAQSSQSSIINSSNQELQSSGISSLSQISTSANTSSSGIDSAGNSSSSSSGSEEVEMINQTEKYMEMWRPKYHYSAQQSWVNDPNGLVYYKGVWHKYYQTNPNTNVFGNIHWGHATSTDLVHWQEHEPVLAPDNVGLMFSGTAVVDHNNTTGFFTNTQDKKGIVVAYSTDTQHIGIAYSLDDGYTFTKVSTTQPVIQNPNEEHFRDPHIFWYEERQEWIMVIAGGFVRYYASSDLVHWTHRSTSNIWTECPNLVKFKVKGTNDYKWLLYCGGKGYYVGSFNGTTFNPETGYIAIEGPDTYAGITYANTPNDRLVMSSWLNNWDYTAPEGIWNGCFALPVELELVRNGNSYKLIQNPVQEVSAIKGDELLSVSNKTYTNTNALAGLKSNSFELNTEIDINNSSDFTLSFCIGEGDKTSITYKKSTSEIFFDRTQSKYGFEALKQKGNFSFRVEPSSCINGILKLRLFVDVDNMELFVNDGFHYFVARIQPFTSSQDMSLIGNNVVVKSLTVNKCKALFTGENAVAIHLGDETPIFAKIGEQVSRDYCVLGDQEANLTVGDTSLINATIQNGKLKVEGLRSGVTWVKISAGNYYKQLEVVAYNEGESYFNNQLGNLTVNGGKIEISPLDMTIISNGGDAVALSNVNAKNVEYSADIRLEDAGAGALLIRATDADSFYSINIDKNANIVKFWKKVNGNVNDIAIKNISLQAREFYNLKVVAKGCSIKIYLNNELIIDAVDYSLTEGKLGLNVFQTRARFNNIKYTLLSQEQGSLESLGELTKQNAEVYVQDNLLDFNNVGGGDAFAIGTTTGGNYTVSGDIALGGVGAGSLIVRYLDGNNFYCVNVDNQTNVVKLWKKVNGVDNIIAQHGTNIAQGTFYNLKIVLNGISLKVYLNNALVITATDGDIANGRVGINSWITDCYFKNISVEHSLGLTYLGKVTCTNANIVENNKEFSFDNLSSGDASVVGEVQAGNYTVSADITLSGVGAGSFLLRYVDENNFYCVNIDSESSVVKLWKKVNGVSTIVYVKDTTITPNTVYNLKVCLNNANITVYLNNVQQFSLTDTSLSYGKIGFNSWHTDFKISNFKYNA